MYFCVIAVAVLARVAGIMRAVEVEPRRRRPALSTVVVVFAVMNTLPGQELITPFHQNLLRLRPVFACGAVAGTTTLCFRWSRQMTSHGFPDKPCDAVT